MDFQYVLLIIFVLLMVYFIVRQRKNIQISGIFPIFYFAMWRTQYGVKMMDRIASAAPRFWKGFFGLGIVACFGGMALICYELVKNTIMLFTEPGVAAGIQPVLPFQAKGVFFVPFVYWILSIFIIAVLHEYCHGIAARVFKMPVKSAGLAFLGIIAPIVPAAFVEPDERQLVKRSRFQQLSVFAAGPFANLVTAGLVMLLVVSVANPIAEAMLLPGGVKITNVAENSPAELAGLEKDMIITSIDGEPTTYLENLTAALQAKRPGDTITLQTHVGEFSVPLTSSENNASKAFLGVFSRQHADIKDDFKAAYGSWSPPIILWLFGLLYWLFLLSIGIGLFNLLPIGPIDGGRMLQVSMQKIFKQRGGTSVWKFISLVFLGLVIVNVIAGFMG